MIPDFPHSIKIRLAPLNFFSCILTLQRQDATNSFFDGAILISWGKSGTYHQIWIQSYLGFIVSDLDVDSPKINPGVSLRVGGSMVDKRSEKSKKIL